MAYGSDEAAARAITSYRFRGLGALLHRAKSDEYFAQASVLFQQTEALRVNWDQTSLAGMELNAGLLIGVLADGKTVGCYLRPTVPFLLHAVTVTRVHAPSPQSRGPAG